ncbi:hypothetical protein CVT24_003791 [Panaeolus cyanescens]|uniref:F-box domain-containing protein n=1 Tax=Panaeolus cyanescens TaxID=181874 RepID=A0A409W834_9AGAR|nr:hypothetical protein CVT24_003791 [Panaeolus cyanescens]
MLTLLPPELIHKICESLYSWRKIQNLHLASVFDVFRMLSVSNVEVQGRAPSSLGNLRLVCKELNAVIIPLLFSEVVFDFYADVNRNPDASLASHLQQVAYGNSPLCSNAQTLRISALCPRQKISNNAERRIREALIEDCLESYLGQAISCMKNLRYVCMEKLSIQDMKYFPLILPHLSALPLEHLSMDAGDFFNWTAPLPIPNTTTVTKLKLVLNAELAFISSTVDQIRDAVMSNSLLEDLDIQLSHTRADSPCQNLLISSPNIVSLRALKHLRITHSLLSEDAAVITHIPVMKSLKLQGMDPTLSSIWDNLKSSNIHLEELEVDSFSRPMMGYIASFSGLTRFVMLEVNAPKKPDYLGAAALEEDSEFFFKVALPNHCATITTLQIHANTWRPFCFCPSFAKSLMPCFRLTDCSLTLNYDEGVEQALQFMITSIISRPSSKQLRSLTLFSAATTQKLDIVTQHWQLHHKQANATVRWLRSIEIHEPDQYPQIIHLPQIDDVPLLVMTPCSEQEGVFKYVKEYK